MKKGKLFLIFMLGVSLPLILLSLSANRVEAAISGNPPVQGLAIGAQATALGSAPQATAGLPATGSTSTVWYSNPFVWLIFAVIILAIIAIVVIADRPRELP